MKIENGDECTYVCENCGDEIVGVPSKHGDYRFNHFCSSSCAMKWFHMPVHATVNSVLVMP